MMAIVTPTMVVTWGSTWWHLIIHLLLLATSWNDLLGLLITITRSLELLLVIFMIFSRFVDPSQHTQIFLLNWHSLIQWFSFDLLLQALLLSRSQHSYLLIIKVFEVLIWDFAQLVISFKQQIVRSSDMVMLIRVDALHCIIFFEVIFDQ